MIYLSGAIVRHRHERLGFILTPDMGNGAPDGCVVGVDNACFNNPQGYSDERYFGFLKRMPRERTLFATAPDVLGSHADTVKRSVPVLHALRQLGFRPAFVAQDGWDEASTPWEAFDVLFVGGSTEFKFRGGREAVAAATKRGKNSHMGRVNSLDRLRAALGIGCKSADGTYLKYGPDVNWPKLKWWLDHLTEQTGMAI